MNKYEDMVKALSKPGAEIVASMTGDEAHILHMAVGVMGETCEFVKTISVPADEEGAKNMIEEMGDVEFYFEGLRQGINTHPTRYLTSSIRSTNNALIKLVITAGELLDTAKKLVVYKDSTKMELLHQNMQDFVSVFDWFYLDLGITQEEVLKGNMKKLGKRYEDFKYSDRAAQQRVDKNGGQHGKDY